MQRNVKLAGWAIRMCNKGKPQGLYFETNTDTKRRAIQSFNAKRPEAYWKYNPMRERGQAKAVKIYVEE